MCINIINTYQLYAYFMSIITPKWINFFWCMEYINSLLKYVNILGKKCNIVFPSRALLGL